MVCPSVPPAVGGEVAVELITAPGADDLNTRQRLEANRQGCGIENGTHQRLDVSLNNDRCQTNNRHRRPTHRCRANNYLNGL
jgi:hypothetical protein